MMRKNYGFTLVELMVTLAVAAILLSLAAPSFSSFIKNNRINSAANQIIANMQFARTEAIRNNQAVNVARTGSTTNDLTTGWTIYTDSDSDLGNSAFGAGDVLLKSFEGYDPDSITVKVSASGNNWIAFRSNGLLAEGSGVSVLIAVCDDRNEDYGKLITISPTGRSTLTSASPSSPLASCSP